MNKPPHLVGGIQYALGVVIQGAGIVFAVAMRGDVGIIGGIAAVVVGGMIARNLCCSECGNRITHKRVKMCPSCHVKFWNIGAH